MAETRKIILNSERKNLQGFAVPHKSLVLDYWLKNRNGQVTYNPLDGKHDGAVVIGRVPAESIRFEEIGGENLMVGDLLLAETDAAKEFSSLYDVGAVTGTSLESRGKAIYTTSKDGTKVITFCEVDVVCAVWKAANPDTVIKFEDFGLPADYEPIYQAPITFSEEQEATLEVLSAEQQEDVKRVLFQEEERKAAEEAESLALEEKEKAAEEALRLEEERKAAEEAEKLRLEEVAAAEAEALRLEEERKAKEEAERISLAEKNGFGKLPEPHKTKINQNMTRSLKEVLADKPGRENYGVAILQLSENGKPAPLPETASAYCRELAQAILNDASFGSIIADKAVFQKEGSLGGESARKVLERIAFAEEGVNIPTEIANLDNARIDYLALWLEARLSDDRFMRIFRLIAAQEIDGNAAMIWTQSDPNNYKTAKGIVAPLDWKAQMVKDITRYMYRQVLAERPILLRPSTDSKLAYNKAQTARSEYLRFSKANTHSFLLDQLCRAVLTYAQTDKTRIVGTSGDVVNTAGMFPNHLPTSAVDIRSLTYNDVSKIISRIRLQNFHDTPVNIVMQESIKQTMYNETGVNGITLQDMWGQNGPRSLADKSIDTPWGINMYSRDKVTAIETSGSTPAWAEAGLGYQYLTDENGVVTAFTPALTATMIDGFLAAADGAAMMGIGTINVFETQDPENYGTKFSMDWSAGVAPAYQNCDGLIVGVPSLNA